MLARLAFSFVCDKKGRTATVIGTFREHTLETSEDSAWPRSSITSAIRGGCVLAFDAVLLLLLFAFGGVWDVGVGSVLGGISTNGVCVAGLLFSFFF